MRSELPPWPQPHPWITPLDAIFVVLLAWQRAEYPAALAWYRARYEPRYLKDLARQRYVPVPPAIDVVGFRKALQGVE